MGLLSDGHEELKSFMSMHWPSICITTLVGAAALGGVPQEQALIMKDVVSTKYKTARQAGTLQGLRWNDFCRVAAIN